VSEDVGSLRARLAQPGLKLAATLAAIEALEAAAPEMRCVGVGISSNVSLDLLSTYLRKHALLAGVRLDVRMGRHDDPIADAERFAADGLQAMVLVPFFDNLLPAFEQQIEHLSAAQLADKEAELRARWRLVFDRARTLSFVFVARLHRFGRALDLGRADAVQATLERLDTALREEAAGFANVRLIDSADIVANLGVGAAFDPRFYYRSTAPYAPAFLDELARRVVLASRAFNGYFYKALVLDCDDTLWGGVIGEDLLEGIALDPHSHPGRIYWRMQQEFAALERQGVLLCLCSKNNPSDVEEALQRHPHAVLGERHLALSKVNWQDKASNLRAIAEELGIGLDSLVFVDDSAFECEAVRAALPMVRVFQVPPAVTDYPRVVHEIKELFLCGGVSDESRAKTEQYRARQAAREAARQFPTHEEYLASLDLRVDLRRDDASQVPRISELTLKSNQFNLTTLRQGQAEIRERMERDDGTVYSLRVGDRFGDAGLTGVVLLRWRGEVAEVDAFLMSCRVIGRGVEFSVWPFIARDALAKGCRRLEATYRPTAKNAQVADFYERLGLAVVDAVDGTKRYRVALESFHPPAADWIEVKQ
jgi:FkbH-like protein